MLKWYFWLRWYLNKIFWFKRYLSEIKLLSFGNTAHFPLNEDNQTEMEQYVNGMEKIKPELNDTWTEWQEPKFQSHPCLQKAKFFTFVVSQRHVSQLQTAVQFIKEQNVFIYYNFQTFWSCDTCCWYDQVSKMRPGTFPFDEDMCWNSDHRCLTFKGMFNLFCSSTVQY
jgi:hypothetical protein